MLPQNPTSNDRFLLYPPEYREFADKLLAAMTHASRVEDDRRKHGQICKVLNCLSDSSPVTIYAFWCQEAKQLAREWEELRIATLRAREEHTAYIQRLIAEDQARQAAGHDNATTTTSEHPSPPEASEPTPKAARKYQRIEYTPGVNPFREGSKNARIWDLLVEGGRTKEEIAALSGADEKSVGYLIWLCGHNAIVVERDKGTRTFRLLGPAPTA